MAVRIGITFMVALVFVGNAWANEWEILNRDDGIEVALREEPDRNLPTMRGRPIADAHCRAVWRENVDTMLAKRVKPSRKHAKNAARRSNWRLQSRICATGGLSKRLVRVKVRLVHVAVNPTATEMVPLPEKIFFHQNKISSSTTSIT